MSNEFLTFTIEEVQYAIPVSKVIEVLEYTTVIKIPCSADYIEGIIKSRGQGISVVNLRKKFGLKPKEIDKNTKIIVLEIQNENGTINFGAITDDVQEVVELNIECMEKTPELGNSVAKRFVSGIARKEEGFIIILDVDKIFSPDEAEMLAEKTQE
ncbi:MAG: chemotaxis protein CheW [Treponema sp.]|nr:chemotaxis protein CheW [Treponema sp.]